MDVRANGLPIGCIPPRAGNRALIYGLKTAGMHNISTPRHGLGLYPVPGVQ